MTLLADLQTAARLAKNLDEATKAMNAIANMRENTGRCVFETNATLGNARFEIALDKDQLQRTLTRFITDTKAQLVALGVTLPA
jgi:hypothetical protein